MFDNNTASSSAAGGVGAGAGAASDHAFSNKRKRRPAGTPDPDAEVVSLSPKTLLESDRYVCEICNQGFQRDQNLQMHRRRHKVPWKLLKRETVATGTDAAAAIKKRVFVCPEPSCLHHDPCHALGDLVGIKKHFRRKHSSYKQWVCQRCSKGYAVQSDYKAHLKTCGTRGHSCDCGRVFSRVESFIEHQDACTSRMVVVRPDHHHHLLASSAAACSSGTASSTSPSSDTANFSTIVPFPHHPPPKLTTLSKPSAECMANNINNKSGPSNLELQFLLPPSSPPPTNTSLLFPPDKNNRVTAAAATHLKLSIGSSSSCHMDDYNETKTTEMQARRLKEVASEEMNLAVAEKAFAEEARQEAKRQIEMAEMEFVNAKRIRQQAQAELEKARILKDEAVKKVSCTILQITCHSCKQQFQVQPHPQQQQLLLPPPSDEMSFAVSYMSSATEGEGEL